MYLDGEANSAAVKAELRQLKQAHREDRTHVVRSHSAMYVHIKYHSRHCHVHLERCSDEEQERG